MFILLFNWFDFVMFMLIYVVVARNEEDNIIFLLGWLFWWPCLCLGFDCKRWNNGCLNKSAISGFNNSYSSRSLEFWFNNLVIDWWVEFFFNGGILIQSK